jgi:hypothetical protein
MKKRGRPSKNSADKIDIEKEIEDEIEDIEKSTEREQIEECFEFSTSGCDIFNLVASGNVDFAFAWGSFINIVGDSQSAKTLIASEIVAAIVKKYGDEVEYDYDDAEHRYTFNSRKIWGIDIVPEDNEGSDTIEDFQTRFTRKLENLEDGKRLLYVLDSYDSLGSDDETKFVDKKLKAYEKSKDSTKEPGEKEEKTKGSYGTSKAKGSSQFFRSLKKGIRNKKCILIIISQVRENLGAGMFSPKYYRTGGKALDFYPMQVFWLASPEKHYAGDKWIGSTVKILNTKNGVGFPYREGYAEIVLNYGVDNVTSNILYLYDLRTEYGKYAKGATTKKLDWDGKEFTLRKLVRHIEKNNLEEELRKRISTKWNDEEKKADVVSDRKRKF